MMAQMIDVIMRFIMGVCVGYSVGMVLFLKLKMKLLDGENTILKMRVDLLELKVQAQERVVFHDFKNARD